MTHTTDTQRGADGGEGLRVMTVKQQWDEIHAAAHRLDTFCRTIEALRLNGAHDTTEEVNFMERAAWCEARHIAELAALIPSPFAALTHPAPSSEDGGARGRKGAMR